MLEASFGKSRHFDTGDGFDTATNDFTLERVKTVDVIIGEFDKRDPFGDFNDARAREWAESFEPEMPRRCISARIRPAETATVGKGMLNSPDAPPFLVEHL